MRKPRYLFVALAALLVLLGACGREGGEGLPGTDTVPPNPPVGLQIEPGDGVVLITWSENPEVDLAGYRLYKSSYEDGPFGIVNSDLLLCTWYRDKVSPRTVTYYKVTAVDESGNESAFSQIIGINTDGDNKTGPEKPQE